MCDLISQASMRSAEDILSLTHASLQIYETWSSETRRSSKLDTHGYNCSKKDTNGFTKKHSYPHQENLLFLKKII